MIWAWLVILISAAATAMTGFGFNLLSVPLLTFVYPPHVIVTVTLILGAVVSGSQLVHADLRRELDWSLAGPLFLASLIGMPAGAMLLLSDHARILKILIATLTTLVALSMLVPFRPRLRAGWPGLLAVGTLSGFLSTSTGLNGPPVAFYLLARDLPKNRFRANMLLFVFLATVSSLGTLAIVGAITPAILRLALRLLTVVPLGLVGGFLLARRLSQRRFEGMVLGFLALVGLLGLGNALR